MLITKTTRNVKFATKNNILRKIFSLQIVFRKIHAEQLQPSLFVWRIVRWIILFDQLDNFFDHFRDTRPAGPRLFFQHNFVCGARRVSFIDPIQPKMQNVFFPRFNSIRIHHVAIRSNTVVVLLSDAESIIVYCNHKNADFLSCHVLSGYWWFTCNIDNWFWW